MNDNAPLKIAVALALVMLMLPNGNLVYTGEPSATKFDRSPGETWLPDIASFV